MSINDAIRLLLTYSGEDELTLRKGASEDELRKVEEVWNITLPDDFKAFYQFADGFETAEEMFNLVTLEEMIWRKSSYSEDPLYIAEYAIYCEAWLLEINPDDCNDYKIIVQSNYNNLVLTQSLAEFIERALTRGIYNPGGLVDWQEEIEALPIYSTKIKATESLLTVFHYGLTHSVIAYKEIVDWAEAIVMHENEPETFFMELSMARNENEVASLLQSRLKPHDSTIARALLGLLYDRLSTKKIDVLQAVKAMDKFDFSALLLPSENMQINKVTEVIWINESIFSKEELTQKLLKFLVKYRDLGISNYKYWLSQSLRIAYTIREEEENDH